MNRLKVMININDKKKLDRIAQAIFDKKGFNILGLDLREESALTDYFIIAEGTSERHVSALSQIVQDNLKELGLTPYRTEGQSTGNWVVLDYGDMIIHLFQSEVREKYGLEQVWKNSRLIDFTIKVKHAT